MNIKSLITAIILIIAPINSSIAQEMSSDLESDLVSPDSQVDYNVLADYLSQKQWRKANDETRNMLLEATGRRAIGWARTEDLQKLSCWDLKTIDRLWKQYSENRFGFSSQFPIYIETGNRPGKLISDDSYNRFGDRLGWRKDGDWIIFIENLNYSIDAPTGHLPNPRPEYSITGGRLYYSTLAEKMVECKIIE